MARFDDSRATLALGRAIQPHLGRMLAISFEPLSPDDRRPLPSDHPVSGAGNESAEELTGTKKWYANPVVKTVVEAFNGEINDIRE